MGSGFSLVNEVVNNIIFCLIFTSRASSMVNGDLMFSVRYDIGCLLVFSSVTLGWVGGYRARF